jgi:hypothetical protein
MHAGQPCKRSAWGPWPRIAWGPGPLMAWMHVLRETHPEQPPHTHTYTGGHARAHPPPPLLQDLIPANVPIISVSKGAEVTTGQLMSDLIPSALGRKQPQVFLSGPTFASEVRTLNPKQ